MGRKVYLLVVRRGSIQPKSMGLAPIFSGPIATANCLPNFRVWASSQKRTPAQYVSKHFFTFDWRMPMSARNMRGCHHLQLLAKHFSKKIWIVYNIVMQWMLCRWCIHKTTLHCSQEIQSLRYNGLSVQNFFGERLGGVWGVLRVPGGSHNPSTSVLPSKCFTFSVTTLIIVK